MKKLLLLSMAFCCLTFASAAETKLFTGDTTPSLFSRIDMVAWAMGEIATDARYVNFGTAEAPAFATETTNPVKTGLNTTEKSIQLTSLKGKSWWPDFMNMNLITPIVITEENRYLHFYHYRENLNQGFSVNINKETTWEDADKGKKRFDMNLSKPGQWEDVVVDLKWFLDNNEAFSSICVLMDMNWGGGAEPVTNYYFDEIVLNNSKLPRGITIYPETVMSLFPGNTASYNKWVSTLDLQNAENTSEIVDNPFTSEMNVLNSTKILKFNKSANASWWQGARFKFTGTMAVGVAGASSYLHVMVNIPDFPVETPAKDYYVIQLNAKDFSGTEMNSGDAVKYWADDKGKWIDCVFDVTTMGYVSEIAVRCDVRKDALDAYVNSPANVFYMDAIEISANADSRAVVVAPNAVYTPSASNVKIYSVERTVIVEGNLASIEVYNMLGKSVSKLAVNQFRTELPLLQGGAYLVKTVTVNGEVSNTKVLIK